MKLFNINLENYLKSENYCEHVSRPLWRLINLNKFAIFDHSHRPFKTPYNADRSIAHLLNVFIKYLNDH